MKKTVLLSTVLSGFVLSTFWSACQKNEPSPLEVYNQRMEWFAEAQYGMFIHFGLYSVLGGEWKGKEADFYSEWIQAQENIPRKEYAQLIRRFNPEGFDAGFIARTAKEAGMKYLVITAKHHEGFCLWDSAYTNFDVAGSPFKERDLLAELSEACRKEGLKFGIYYSILDWHHPSQVNDPSQTKPRRNWSRTLMAEGQKPSYIEYQTNQILELIENYEPDLLWFDGDWVNWWTIEDGLHLYNTIREADPDIIVNNRVGKREFFEMDYVTQEQKHFKDAINKHWEGCYTMNKSWGYKKHDHEWKDAPTVYNKLKDINEKGGNLLLNVGPDGNGRIQPEALAILKETAQLLKEKPIKKRIPQITEVPGVTETVTLGGETIKVTPKAFEPTLRDVAYGPHERNKLDFWKAESDDPTPVVFYIHGGGWVGGSKEGNKGPSLNLLDQGVSYVSINYRLAQGDNTLPCSLHDAARALQFVRTKAKEWNIDPKRIVASGGSAGGCSSLWLAYHDDLADPDSDDPVERESTRISGVAAIKAQSTINPWLVDKRLGPSASHHKMIWGTVGAFSLEDLFENWEKYKALSNECSPLTHVTGDDPPVFIVYDADTPAPPERDGIHHVEFGRILQEKCEPLGLKCTIAFHGKADRQAALDQFMLQRLEHVVFY